MTETKRTAIALEAALEIDDFGLLIATHIGILCLLVAKFLDGVKKEESDDSTKTN